MTDSIRWETDGPVVTITMNRPQVHNALDPEAYDALFAAFRRFGDDRTLRVAILTGAGGRAFSTGSDMRSGNWQSTDGAPRTVTELYEPFWVEKPVIAAIDGWCLGGGLEWALRCDIRLATEQSRFGLPEPRAGSLAGFGLHMLSRHVPPGDALYMQLTGDHIDGERALRIGLVQELLVPDALLARARGIADAICLCAPLAVEAIKQTVTFGVRRGVEDSYRYVRPFAERLGRSADAVEGPRAFAEKRPPRWETPE